LSYEPSYLRPVRMSAAPYGTGDLGRHRQRKPRTSVGSVQPLGGFPVLTNSARSSASRSVLAVCAVLVLLGTGWTVSPFAAHASISPSPLGSFVQQLRDTPSAAPASDNPLQFAPLGKATEVPEFLPAPPVGVDPASTFTLQTVEFRGAYPRGYDTRTDAPFTATFRLTLTEANALGAPPVCVSEFTELVDGGAPRPFPSLSTPCPGLVPATAYVALVEVLSYPQPRTSGATSFPGIYGNCFVNRGGIFSPTFQRPSDPAPVVLTNSAGDSCSTFVGLSGRYIPSAAPAPAPITPTPVASTTPTPGAAPFPVVSVSPAPVAPSDPPPVAPPVASSPPVVVAPPVPSVAPSAPVDPSPVAPAPSPTTAPPVVAPPPGAPSPVVTTPPPVAPSPVVTTSPPASPPPASSPCPDFTQRGGLVRAHGERAPCPGTPVPTDCLVSSHLTSPNGQDGSLRLSPRPGVPSSAALVGSAEVSSVDSGTYYIGETQPDGSRVFGLPLPPGVAGTLRSFLVKTAPGECRLSYRAARDEPAPLVARTPAPTPAPPALLPAPFVPTVPQLPMTGATVPLVLAVLLGSFLVLTGLVLLVLVRLRRRVRRLVTSAPVQHLAANVRTRLPGMF
jgi:hypothetical protein